jgi:hypothetical protein
MSQGAKSPFDDIRPDRGGEGRAPAPVAAIDRMAESRGFVSRDAPEVAIKRPRGTDRTVHQFTMRVRVADSNRFVQWCVDNRLSYREGFEQVVELLAKHGTR